MYWLFYQLHTCKRKTFHQRHLFFAKMITHLYSTVFISSKVVSSSSSLPLTESSVGTFYTALNDKKVENLVPFHKHLHVQSWIHANLDTPRQFYLIKVPRIHLRHPAFHYDGLTGMPAALFLTWPAKNTFRNRAKTVSPICRLKKNVYANKETSKAGNCQFPEKSECISGEPWNYLMTSQINLCFRNLRILHPHSHNIAVFYVS